jgi:hypothetical protein
VAVTGGIAGFSIVPNLSGRTMELYFIGSASTSILRNGNKRSSTLVEGKRLVQVGSWAFNPSGFDYWSSELFEIHGLDAAGKAPTKEEYLELVHPEDREFVVQQIQRMLTDHSGFDFLSELCGLTERFVAFVAWAPRRPKPGLCEGS